MSKNSMKSTLENSIMFSKPVEAQKVEEKPVRSSQKGLPDGWERFTAIMKTETINELKDYAYTERLQYKEALDSIISSFLAEYKKTHELMKDPKRK